MISEYIKMNKTKKNQKDYLDKINQKLKKKKTKIKNSKIAKKKLMK